MSKEEVIKRLQEKFGHLACWPNVLDQAETLLQENEQYSLDEAESEIKVTTIVKDLERGIFQLLKVHENRETGDATILAIKKEYNPQNEVRYDFMTRVGTNMFTDARTASYDKDGVQTYSSWYSDEHKYYPAPETSDLKGYLKKAFEETTPKYDKDGRIISGPERSYRPFTTICERIGKTRVIHRHGRNPMKGAFSEVGVVYKDGEGKEKEDYFLKENHGRIYSSKGWFGKLEDEAPKIDAMIDENLEFDEFRGETVLKSYVITDKLLEDAEREEHDDSGEVADWD